MKQQPHETDGPPRDGLLRVKRGRHKPEVPPRRNPPPPDSSVKVKGATCAHPSETAGVSGRRPTIAERVAPASGPTQKDSAIASPESGLTLGFDPDSSSPFLIDGALIKGVETTLARPSVTFAPNLMILMTTDSDGSPVKLGSKETGKRLAAGSENAKLPSQEENQGALVSSLKKGSEGVANTPAPSRPEEPEDCHLRDLYTQVNDLVSSNPDEMREINEDEAEDPSAVPMIWVSKWVDYTDKYGLGYQLSDDSIGVLFNDFTKLLLLPDGENIHYIERTGQEHYHQLNDHPDSLHKKVTLLRYFRNYMNEHLLKAGAKMVRQREGDELARIPSLKTHCRTRSAIVLLLTNGTLQINFFEDHTKIILCPLMGAVTYIDKKRNFRTFRLEMLKKFGCSNDLGNRLRYARNMIQKLLLLKSGSSIKLGSAGLVAFPQPSPHSKQVT